MVDQRPEAGPAEQRATIGAQFFPAVVGTCRHCDKPTKDSSGQHWTHRRGGIRCGVDGHHADPEVSSACVHIAEQFVYLRIENGTVHIDVDVEANPALFPGACVPIVFEVRGAPVASFDAAGVFTAHAA